MSADNADEQVELGRLNGVWGVAGWVKVFSHTTPADNIFTYQPWRTEGSPGLLRVLEWRQQGPRLVARLDGITTREQAEALHGVRLFALRSDLPSPQPSQYYWYELIGMNVFNREGVALGVVHGLLDAGAHDVLQVRRADGRPDILVPFVQDHFIDRVDRPRRRIDVDWDPEWTDAD